MTMIASARGGEVDQDLANGLVEARRDEHLADAAQRDGHQEQTRAVR